MKSSWRAIGGVIVLVGSVGLMAGLALIGQVSFPPSSPASPSVSAATPPCPAGLPPILAPRSRSFPYVPPPPPPPTAPPYPMARAPALGRLATPTPFLPPTPTVIPTAGFPLTPILVPPAFPTPTGLPPTRLGVYMSEEGWFEYDAKQRGKNPFAEMARFSSAVVLGSIRELDPPIFLTPPTNRWDQPESVLSPAMLQVEHVYRGPSAATLRVVHPGACFTAADCLPDIVHYRWSDLIGYHLLLC